MSEERQEAPSLLNALDTLDDAQRLVEAVFMAAQALSRDECAALHAVLDSAKRKLEDVEAKLDAIREGEEGGEA